MDIVFALLCAAVLPRIDTGTLEAQFNERNNRCPVISAKGADGRSFGVLLMCRVWYHGRTGNAERFYEDQDELRWATAGFENDGISAVTRTGTVDYDVTRTVERSAGEDALTLDYVLEAKESRYYDPITFPLMSFNKEAETVSYDDGTLGNWKNAEDPSNVDVINSRAILLHYPKQDRTVAVLLDVNRPMELGHPVGAAFTIAKAGWCRSVSVRQLWQDEMPFYAKGTKVGTRLYFKALKGAKPGEEQYAAVRALAERAGAQAAKFSPRYFDGEFVKPSSLAAELAGADGVRIWSETPMHRVYPQTEAPAAKGGGVALESAANERESVQIVIRPETETKLEGVEFADLRSASGEAVPAKGFSANLLGYERITDWRAVYAGETRFADRMMPVKGAVTLAAKENSVLHLTFFTPPGTKAGRYAGAVALKLGGKTVKVPVELKVWGVELPEKSAFTTHMLIWNSPVERREEVLKRFSEYGMMGTVYTGKGSPKLKECFDGETLTLPDGFALAEKSIRDYRAGYFQIPWCFMGAWNWNTNKTVFLGLDLRIDSPEFDRNFTNYIASAHRQLKARGIEKRSFLYMWDEMTEGHYTAMRKTTDLVHRYAPGVKILTVSAPDPEVVANNDIIVTSIPSHWWNADAPGVVKRANAAGKEIWIYANSLTFGTRSRAAIPRLTAWIAKAMGARGYLHWSCDYNWKANDFAKNGNEWLLYPSEGEPVYSVRAEYYRDGVEDFNLMMLARKLDRETRRTLEKRIATVVSLKGAIDADPAKVLAVRRAIAEALEKAE